jgi:hypothetical protein
MPRTTCVLGLRLGFVVQGAVFAFLCAACGGRAQQPSHEEPPLPGSAAAGSVPTGTTGGDAATAPGGRGGMATSPAAGAPDGDAGSSPEPSQAAGGSGPEAPQMPTCAAQSGALRAQLLWQDAFTFSGSSDYPYMGISPDGTSLILPIEEAVHSAGNRSYSLPAGELLVQPLPAVLSRDDGWSRELLAQHGLPISVGSLVEMTQGRVLTSFPTEQAWPLQARLSADGQYLFRLRCQDGLRIERVGIDDGEIASIPLGPAESLCVDYGHASFIIPLAPSHENEKVVVAAERRGFALADFSSGSATFSVPADAPSTTDERTPNEPLPRDTIALELSPSEHTLAIIDAAGTLRMLSYPEIVQELPDITTAVTSAFTQNYVTRRSFAPIAWSPDERYLATADDAHATVVRRACDGSVAVTLPNPAPNPERPNDDPNVAPAFLTFNRQGLALAVLRLNKQLQATVSYYALSPALSN